MDESGMLGQSEKKIEREREEKRGRNERAREDSSSIHNAKKHLIRLRQKPKGIQTIISSDEIIQNRMRIVIEEIKRERERK